jgi:hypothetical protein
MKVEQPSKVIELGERCNRSWPTMAKAAKAAPEERAKLRAKLEPAGLIPADTSLVVFGSLARGEVTEGSDLDWTLLVDGQVDVQHAVIARRIADVVTGERKPPGPTGVFGGLTFSHDIVHFIGGDDDSNTNTTRRILLLLESSCLTDDVIRQRVLRALLGRYVGEDLLYHEPAKFLVPRFLLNDYVRYWRTMAVDSAQKRRDRSDTWALRNIKLRISRKLIFVAGLWACISCRLHPSDELKESRVENDRDSVLTDMTQFLLSFSQRSPLETLATAFLTYGATDAAQTAFDAYEDFLAILNDANLRGGLEKLKVSEAVSDSAFKRAKQAAENFQAGLSKLLFDTNDELTEVARTFGVF